MIEFIKQNGFQFLFSAIAGALSLAVKGLYARVKRELLEQEQIKQGVLAILHDRLYQACKFFLKRGWCSVDDLENLEYLYTSYHDLGGNGTGTDLYNRVRLLIIRNLEDDME